MLKRKLAGLVLAFLLITTVSTVTEIDFIITADAAQNVDISECNIDNLKNKAYTGKKITQDVKVTYEGKTLEKGKDYTLSYKNNIKIGTASVKISGIGAYSGSVIKTFNIRLKTVNITNVSQKDQKVTLEWKKVIGADGYKIYYSDKENGDYKVLKTIKNNSTSSYTSAKSFERGSVYYFYIVSYKEADGKSYQSTKTPAHKINIPSSDPSVEGKWKLGYIHVDDKRYTVEEYFNYVLGTDSLSYYDFYIEYYVEYYSSLFDSIHAEFKNDGTLTIVGYDESAYEQTVHYEQYGNVVSVVYDDNVAGLWFLNESGTELSVEQEILGNEVLIFVRI